VSLGVSESEGRSGEVKLALGGWNQAPTGLEVAPKIWQF